MDALKIARVLVGIAAIAVGIYTLCDALISGEIKTSALLLCVLLCCLCALAMRFKSNGSGIEADRKH